MLVNTFTIVVADLAVVFTFSQLYPQSLPQRILSSQFLRQKLFLQLSLSTVSGTKILSAAPRNDLFSYVACIRYQTI